MNDTEAGLTPVQAAEYLGVSKATLALWRSKSKGPPFYRIGERLVRYPIPGLDAWREQRLNHPQSKNGVPAHGRAHASRKHR